MSDNMEKSGMNITSGFFKKVSVKTHRSKFAKRILVISLAPIYVRKYNYIRYRNHGSRQRTKSRPTFLKVSQQDISPIPLR